MRGYRHKSITRRHNDDEQEAEGGRRLMGLKERISNRLGRENGEDQSPSDESPEDDSVEDSDDREP